MAKKRFGALAGMASGEDDANREHVELEEHIEAQTRGKAMKADPKAAQSASVAQAATPADAPAAASGEPIAKAGPATAVKPEADQAEAKKAADVEKAAAPEEPEVPDPASLLSDLLRQVGNPANAAARVNSEAMQAMPAAPTQPSSVDDAPARGPKKGDAPVPQGGPAMVQPMAAAPAGASVADVAGRLAAGVVAAPFLALSSAHRHLAAKFGSADKSLATSGPSTGLKASAMAAAPIASIEMITNWKCEKIEEAASDVLRTAERVRSLDAFVVWEDSMLREAAKRQVLPQEVVSQMRVDPDLSPLREQMNSLWRDNPKAVAEFRRSADSFEKHVKDVVKKYPNSDEQIQKRVLEAMDTVRDNVSDLPGFGKEEGEYTATLVERIAELARMLAELVAKLFARLTGRAPSGAPSISQ